MALSRMAKSVLIGAALLAVVIGTTLGVVLTIQKDAPKTSAEKLLRLRELMQAHNVEAYIIPAVDAHQSEYISYRDRRIGYISDFTGSAGEIYVTDTAAALWTDSRYHIQAEEQLNADLWTLMKRGQPDVPTPLEWLAAGIRVGIDPFLVDAEQFGMLEASLKRAGSVLVQITPNLVDEVWTDKPQQQLPAIEPLAIEFSGRRVAAKVADLREVIASQGATAAVVSALDDVAWLLNLRGRDIINNPVFYAYVLVTRTAVELYVLDAQRINATHTAHFGREEITVTVRDYDQITVGIRAALDAGSGAGKVLLSLPNQALYSTVPAERMVMIASPVNRLKVVKNAVEATGMRRAHVRDGAAVIKYLHWLDGHIDGERVTELSGAAELGRFRAQGEHFQTLSFGAISAVGAHAAMAHYSPTAATDRRITRDEIYLIDSGGQYLDGTTDITRTVHFGRPSDVQRDSFTRVLKGAISLSRAVFPVGADPSIFDAMARRSLWDVGLDYGHGTGHGVGAYLNVHEYPPLLSRRSGAGLLENMFTSNEPGYYEEGEYGIRIEDVVQVVRADETMLRGNFNGLGALTFFDLTMAPIQVGLIREELLTAPEARWLNDFHARVRDGTRGLLSAEVYEWLVRQTPNVTFGGACGRDECATQCGA